MADSRPEDLAAQNIKDRAELAALRYNQALKGIETQRSALDELRSRTGLLISATSISTSFLGSVAAKDHPGFPPEFLWALVPFGVSIFLAFVILAPLNKWSFFLNSQAFLAVSGRPAEEGLTELSGTLESNAETNSEKLDRLSIAFLISAAALLWSIVAWIVVIE